MEKDAKASIFEGDIVMQPIFFFVKKLHTYAGKTLYLSMLGMIGISLLEGIGILFLIPMLSLSGIININADGTPISRILEFFQSFSNTLGLSIILLIYAIMVIGQNALQRQITIRNTSIQHGFFRHLRIETYESLLYANWEFYLKKRKSDLINSLTTEIATASAGTHSFLQFIASLIFTFIQIVIALWLSVHITIFVLFSGLLLVFFSRKYLKRSLDLGKVNHELGKNYLGGITEQINGIKDVKSNNLEDSRMEWYRSVTLKIQEEQVNYSMLNTKTQLYYKAASAILIAAFIYVAVMMFQAQTSQLMLIIIIFTRLWPRVASIQASMEQIATRIPSYVSVINLQKESNESREFKHEYNNNLNPITLKYGIECRNVQFRYHKDQPLYALQNINLLIPSNKMTAVVGRSGAGKSTLIDLLMGLNKPETGEVLIDGAPLTDHSLPSLRRSISYVPQDPFLFNSSIRDNLIIVRPDADEQQLWDALEFSSAAEFVMRLPNGLDTLIGDRGVKLSGGERQRLVLARAILREPSILVLDEATSSLDSENEAKIQEALERLKGKMTIIVIAHRLSTIRDAEQVIVLQEGKIVQNGDFNTLTEDKKSPFARMVMNQVSATSL